MLADSFADEDDSADGNDTAAGDAADKAGISSLEIAKLMFPQSVQRTRVLQRAVSIARSAGSPVPRFEELFTPEKEKVGTTINASPRPNI